MRSQKYSKYIPTGPRNKYQKYQYLNSMSLKLLLKLLTYNYLLSLKNKRFTKTKREFTSLDTIPGVAEFVLRRETVRRYETVLCKLHNTSGIEVFSKAQEVVSMEILGSWCYTRGSRAASILSGEPSVPGKFQVV